MQIMKAHLIGIGGIGVSALAQYLYAHGYSITGSNQSRNAQTDLVQEKTKASIYFHHATENIDPDTDLVIYSPAVPYDNPERACARENAIPEYSYPEYLGKISQEKQTIAIAGTNGKTTTTAMLGTVADEALLNPTIIVGGIMPRFESNCRIGESNLFIVEACEYKDSFLSIMPDILVITNITPDHLDYFKTEANYVSAFMQFVKNIKPGGSLILDTANRSMQEIILVAKEHNITVMDYGQYSHDSWNLTLPGEHNIANASAAMAAAVLLGIPPTVIKDTLENEFLTPKRRFELIGMTEDGAVVYDDYAHNPEGLELLIDGVRRSYPDKQIVLVFSPHLYSRTQELFDGFTRELSRVDHLYLLPIYPARERAEDFQVTSQSLADAIDRLQNKPKMVRVTSSVDDCIYRINDADYDGDCIILTVGAGHTDMVARGLAQ